VPHLWLQDESDSWAVFPLEGDRLELASIPAPAFRALGAGAAGAPRATLIRVPSPQREQWVLLAPHSTGITVDGIPLAAGIRALTDRAEVRVRGAATFFFSAERLARIEPFPALERSATCPRCRQEIATGTPAVRCPGCDLWHHASDDLPCWTYAPTCALCPQSTDPDAGFRWSPEDL
jgi:hypothetical protein